MFPLGLRRSALTLGLCLMPAGMILAQQGEAERPSGEPRRAPQVRIIQRPPVTPDQRARLEEQRARLQEQQAQMQERLNGIYRELPEQFGEQQIETFRGMFLDLMTPPTVELGLVLRPVPEVLRSHLDLPKAGGLLVEAVAEGSPAAGVIEKNDILLKLREAPQASENDDLQEFTETEINEPGDVGKALEAIEGDSIYAVVMRQGKILQVGLDRRASEQEPEEAAPTTYRIGVAINEPDDAVRAQLGLPEGQGVIVMEIAPDSAAEKAGIKVNDVLITLDGEPILGAAELAELVGKSGGEAVELELLRDGERTTIEVTPDAVEAAEEPARREGARRPIAPRVGPGMRFYGPGVMIDPETGAVFPPGPGGMRGPGAGRQPFELREFRIPPASPEMGKQLEELQEQVKELREEIEALKRARENRPERRGRDGRN